MVPSRRVLLVAALFLLRCAYAVSAAGQEKSPVGEAYTSITENIKGDYGLLYGPRILRISVYDGGFDLNWTPPKGRDIIFAGSKDDNPDIVFILLDDGTIYETIASNEPKIWDDPPRVRSKADPKDGLQAYNKIIGDALYTLSSKAVYVSRDAAATWKVDTSGVPPGFVYNDLALDTSQNPWLAHGTGLWKQHPDSNVWRKVTSFPKSNATAIFVDRRNRILAGSFQQAYMSTNSGATWTIDTTGLNGQTVTKFCDDAFGNLYAMSSNRIWKSTGGTQSWSRIDQSLSSFSNDPSISQVFNSISGDTALHAATVFGGYLSRDRGVTWVRDTLQFPARSIYGLAKTSSGKLFTSTNLGIFTKSSPILDWSKVFPSQGYLAASPLNVDGSGAVYTLGARINPTNPNSLRTNWKSTDGGATWNPDTLGLGTIGAGQGQVYWVDESGVQHLAGFDTPAKMYSKASGKAWAVDTSGYGNKSLDYLNVFGSDKRGNVYAATVNLGTNKGAVYKRSISGGSWVADTGGLGGAQAYWITVDRSGNPVLGTLTGVYRRTGSTWGKIPSPPGLDAANAFVVSVDSTGALVAGFSTIAGFNSIGRGVFATRNNGASWTYLGLDSITVRGLVSYGDTTYAYTYADGFYKLRSPAGNASSVAETNVPVTFELEQNYPNPFNPTTVIRFSVPQRDRYSLKIFDVLGREVARLLDGELDAGRHEVQFGATNYSSGVYFYQLQSKSAVLTRKLVLLK